MMSDSVGSPGIIWRHLETSGIICEDLRSPAIIWDHVGSSRITWHRLGSTGWDHLWVHLGSPGGPYGRRHRADRRHCHLGFLGGGVKRYSNWFVSAARICGRKLCIFIKSPSNYIVNSKKSSELEFCLSTRITNQKMKCLS